MGGSKVYLDPPMHDPYFLQLFYLGIAPLLLALAARRVGAGRRRALVPVLAATAALVALKLFGVPPVQWLAAVPGLGGVHFAAYLGIPLDFLLALLAAVGFQALARGEVTRARAATVAGLAVLAVLGLLAIAGRRGVFARPNAGLWLRDWWIGGPGRCGGGDGPGLDRLAASGGRGGRPAGASWAVWVVGAAFVAEALVNTVYPRQHRWDVWRHPVPLVEKLMAASGGGRVFTAGVFLANAGSAFEVFTLDSLMTFNSTRVYRLYRRYVAPDTPFFLREASRLPPEGVLDRADLELLAIAESKGGLIAAAEARGYPTIYRDGYARIFRRAGSPRYFFTSEVEVAAGRAALRRLGELPPGRLTLVEKEPCVSPEPNRPDDPAVEIREFHRNGLRLSVDAPRPGLVVCSESSMPGWTARVDGRPAPILAANYAFRAVEVPAGRSEIEFEYRPPGLTAGLVVSAVSAALLVVMVWAPARRRGNRRNLLLPQS